MGCRYIFVSILFLTNEINIKSSESTKSNYKRRRIAGARSSDIIGEFYGGIREEREGVGREGKAGAKCLSTLIADV